MRTSPVRVLRQCKSYPCTRTANNAYHDLAFYIKKTNKHKRLQDTFIYLAQRGNTGDAAYALRYPDASSSESKNRYAVALFDPFVPTLIYAEVLVIPEFVMPSMSAEAIRQNGGTTPPREPVLPSRFTIQLYNPDQQVAIQYKPKTWNSPAVWTFEMPMHSFRQPSSSTLDRTQNDPAAAEFTPKLKFTWRRDGKLSKDLTCVLTGVSTFLPEPKTKRKEADIPIAMFQAHREITLYEPNLYRVEMEDFKGLELVVILGAIVIRDIYSGPLKETFNVAEAAPPRSNGDIARPHSTLPLMTRPSASSLMNYPVAASGALNAGAVGQRNQNGASPVNASYQQEVMAQKTAARLRNEEENRRTREFLEAEDRSRRRRQAEVDKETERLQRVYGEEERRARQQRRQANRNSSHYSTYDPYAHASAMDPRSSHHSTMQLLQAPYMPVDAQPTPQRTSFFGLRRSPGDKVIKKQSSIF